MASRETDLSPGWPRREADRRATWRSVVAGFVVVASLFGILIAASYPAITVLVVATGVGAYATKRLLPPSSLYRRLRLSRTGVSVCFQLRLE